MLVLTSSREEEVRIDLVLKYGTPGIGPLVQMPDIHPDVNRFLLDIQFLPNIDFQDVLRSKSYLGQYFGRYFG